MIASGLTASEQLVLRVLAAEKCLPLTTGALERVVADVAKSFDIRGYYPGVSPSGVARCVNRLQQSGLVARTASGAWGVTYAGLMTFAAYDIDPNLAVSVAESKALLVMMGAQR